MVIVEFANFFPPSLGDFAGITRCEVVKRSRRNDKFRKIFSHCENPGSFCRVKVVADDDDGTGLSDHERAVPLRA